MKTNPKDIALLLFITIISLYIRISVPLSTSFPLNDGGLFYKMILDIQENHFVLPMFTSYNNANIPIAYPPFVFYLYAILAHVGNVPVIKLMQFGPAIISTLSIPVFFLLAREILQTRSQVLFSTLIFSLVPRAFDWLIMGGGVTRSLGFLFALLTIYQSFLLFSTPSTRNILLTSLWSGFVISTHPEAALHALLGSIFILVWKDFTVSGLKRAAIVVAGALFISMPWWYTIISRHGIEPFHNVLSSANQDSYGLVKRLINLFQFDFTDEPFLALTATFGLIGMFSLIAKQKTGLVVWFLLIQLIEPRGGALYMMIPMSMFAGFGLDETIMPMLRRPLDTTNRIRSGLTINLEKMFIGFIFLYSILSATIVTGKIKQLTLSQSDLSAFQWVKEHTLPNSKFIVITQGLPLNDATSEWFPAITERTSMTTIFGYEWLDHDGFHTRAEIYKSLQACATQGVLCLNNWEEETKTIYSYVYIRKTYETADHPFILSEQLKRSPDYLMVYEIEEIQIFQKK